ncbi:MAG TPA: deoxyribonuclease IV [Bacillota bacterium]|jgi:deoxyribonuclease-4|nr:deoxyribonuclease IV [Bacillota bacterium]HPU60635.1 deoxyribonuclease IV [Bacillota bacterium]HPZ91678.1 deoxyribonuclease IV [Bacillota bacterium]HQE02845.1 deoxyribonuclease IV [Bacillota bacterium]
MKFGVHVSKAGGFRNALREAIELQCDTIQVFSGNPRTLRQPKIDEDDVSAFRQGLDKESIGPLVIHAPYLLNLASPKETTYELSVNALADEITRCRILGADYLVFHPGNHVGSGIEAGIKRIADAINKACDMADLTGESGLVLLLEMVSGAGTEIGWTFEQQKAIMGLAKDVPLGICLDTCHMFTAGHNIVTMEGLDEALKELDQILGISSVGIVHANDAVGGLGSRLDRHTDIGKGMIGEEGFRVILGNSMLRKIPFILETPKNGLEDDMRNLATIRRLAQEAVIW